MLLSFVALFAACGPSGNQMRSRLAELEEQNRSGEQMLNDSLAEQLVDYFDSHGTPNERMRSRYILGRTYFDLGELPRSLETYYAARDCADTTVSDCDYKTLSRIHAQSALVLDAQAMAWGELRELRMAEHYARKAMDTIQAIECYSQQANCYKLLHQADSAILVMNHAAQMYAAIGQYERAARKRGGLIDLQIDKGQLDEARKNIIIYECSSGLFDSLGNIRAGREVYYYVKGCYYLAVSKLDSAELLFRKEQMEGKDLNNQIAAAKGLQQLYSRKGIPDSIAKYANRGYELNDSAYSLSELQNIQKLQASYNYAHHKLIAEKKSHEARQTWLLACLIVSVFAFLVLLFFRRYAVFKKAALDYRLQTALPSKRLRKRAKSERSKSLNTELFSNPDFSEWKALRDLVEHAIPRFATLKTSGERELTDFEYDICLMTRIQLSCHEMSVLKSCAPSTITKTRKRLMKILFGRDGTSEDFADEIMNFV